MSRKSQIGIKPISSKSFENWYFEVWHRYHKKRYVISCLYYDVLRWAGKRLGMDLLDGRRRKALDCGCAHGYVVSLLRGLGYDAYGVDLSYTYLHHYAKATLQNMLCCDVHSLPLRDRSFDLITAFELIEHLSRPRAFLSECARILRNQGVLIMTTPLGIKALNLDYLLRSMWLGLVWLGTGNIEGHKTEFLPRTLRRLLESAGFSPNYVEIWWLAPNTF
jgi:SAM-dependent methyltransferase